MTKLAKYNGLRTVGQYDTVTQTQYCQDGTANSSIQNKQCQIGHSPLNFCSQSLKAQDAASCVTFLRCLVGHMSLSLRHGSIVPRQNNSFATTRDFNQSGHTYILQLASASLATKLEQGARNLRLTPQVSLLPRLRKGHAMVRIENFPQKRVQRYFFSFLQKEPENQQAQRRSLKLLDVS